MYDFLLSGLRSDVKWSRQDAGEQRGKLLESQCPPPCHGIAPQSDEIICVNVYGLTHANDSLKDERSFLVSAGQGELGDLRELQPRERKRETCSRSQFTHKTGDGIVSSGSRSPLVCVKRSRRKCTCLLYTSPSPRDS